MLLKTLEDQGFAAKFDFFYLPIDFRNRCNVGYAFINFVSPQDAKRFLSVFHKFKLKVGIFTGSLHQLRVTFILNLCNTLRSSNSSACSTSPS